MGEKDNNSKLQLGKWVSNPHVASDRCCLNFRRDYREDSQKKRRANQNSESKLVVLEIPLLHAACASSDLQDQVLNDHHVFPKFQRWGINSKYQGSQITAPVVIA